MTIVRRPRCGPQYSSTVWSLPSVPIDWITPVILVMSAQIRSTTRPARSALMITLDPGGGRRG